jgi:hypothetical protein
MKKLVEGWDQEGPGGSPVVRYGDLLYFHVCTWRNGCVVPQAAFFINMRDGSVQACWEDKDDMWLSSKGDSHKVPEGYCNPDRYYDAARQVYDMEIMYQNRNNAKPDEANK